MGITGNQLVSQIAQFPIQDLNKKMKTLNTAKQIAKEAATKLALSLTVVSVIGQLSTSPVMAQGLQAGQMGELSQMSGLGADQESLLPPEVVPLDPQAAAKLSQSQAQTRQMNGFDAQPQAAMPDARANRQDAFNTLMGREDLQQQANNQMSQPQFQPINGAQMDQYAPGQLLPQAQQQAGTQYNQQQQPMGVSAWQNPGQNGQAPFPAQTQTMSGKVKRSPLKGIGRSGLSHSLTGLAAFGAGAFTMSRMRSPSMLYSGGIMGLGLANYGLRSGFRF